MQVRAAVELEVGVEARGMAAKPGAVPAEAEAGVRQRTRAVAGGSTGSARWAGKEDRSKPLLEVDDMMVAAGER